jgi:uncharacterized protein with HEPN domain
MPRDPRAYLTDVIVACDAILEATRGLGFQEYLASRLVRSSVEREFMIVGEAMGALLRTMPEIETAVPQARRVVSFRHRLAHEYAFIDDELVWVVAERQVAPLRDACAELLARMDAERPDIGA